jgi:glycosyltransferase involved in cell wall biosynthesis
MTRSLMTEPTATASRVQPSAPTIGKRFAGKRVAMVTFSCYPFDPRPRRVVDALVGEGATIDLICIEDGTNPARESLNGINVRRISLKHERGGKFEYAFKYGAFILISSLIFAMRTFSRRYDLVYVHNMPDILIVSSLIPKLFGTKAVLDLHDPMPELMTTIFNATPNSKSVRLLKILEKWSIARADMAITVNQACKRIFSTRSCRAEKIAVVMNSPDDRIFPFQPEESQVSRTQFNEKRFVIMYHGSLVERNGLDVAVDALTKVREVVPNAELRIFGKNSPFLERVMDKARDRGMQEMVRFIGPRSLEDIVTEIQKCDLGIIPSHRNAFTEINTPVRIFEYLALGKPVIAPATPGIQDYFDNESLLFFEPGNSDDLAQKIEFTFSHALEVKEIVRNGQEVYRTHAWQNERETLISRLSEVIAKT